MRMDIYSRPDTDGKFSYLTVPEGCAIPNEAINTDWVLEERGMNVDDGADTIPEYDISQLKRQLSEKGYAMTSVFH